MIDFFDYTNENQPAKGKLLLSEPFLNDPNFDRTVVLLCEHSDEGSFGFILNKPSEVELNSIMDELNVVEGKAYVGGPVQHNTLHYIHRFPSLEGGQEIKNGLYWGGEFEQLLSILQSENVTEEDIRFFVGYSGWVEGQLEEEHDKIPLDGTVVFICRSGRRSAMAIESLNRLRDSSNWFSLSGGI